MPDHPCNPISSLSVKELEQRFNAVVDAKNAVNLRRSATLADIGDCLLLLDSKLRLYDRDDAFLKSAVHEIQLIKQQSKATGRPIDFLGLELLRSMSRNCKYGQSFYEKHRILCSSVQRILSVKEQATHVAYQYLSDPASLLEHRLLFFATATPQR